MWKYFLECLTLNWVCRMWGENRPAQAVGLPFRERRPAPRAAVPPIVCLQRGSWRLYPACGRVPRHLPDSAHRPRPATPHLDEPS